MSSEISQSGDGPSFAGSAIDIQLLSRFAEFNDFRERYRASTGQAVKPESPPLAQSIQETPKQAPKSELNDSLLEEGGFEPSVPAVIRTVGRPCESRCFERVLGVASTAASWNELDPVGALGRRTHPRLVDEALGRHIDRTSFAALRGMDVQRGSSPCRFSRQRNLVIERLSVVGE